MFDWNVLNLQIAMKELLFSLFLAGWFAFVQQTAPELMIEHPIPGQAVQGMVFIQGFSALEGFASAQVEFRYEDDKTNTWFLIQDQVPAIESGVLASWDTTTITDGIYRVRLMVMKQDGSIAQVEVAGVRVRNYTAVETNTPVAPGEITALPTVTVTPTPLIVLSTPTPPPPNPISITEKELSGSALTGLAVVAVFFIIIGLYQTIRSLTRR